MVTFESWYENDNSPMTFDYKAESEKAWDAGWRQGRLAGLELSRISQANGGYEAGFMDGGKLLNEKYIAAMQELNRYRDMLDKVKSEDLASSVQEREAMLRNQIGIARDQMVYVQNQIDRAVLELQADRKISEDPQFRLCLTKILRILGAEE